jgi:hypothetical protein
MPSAPYKLTPEVHDRIVAAVRAGNYIETAAAFAGISKETLYQWLKSGARADSGPLREFVDAVHQALAAAEVRDITLIGKAAEKNWQAAAWRRERMAPQRWGMRKDPREARLIRDKLRAELALIEARRLALLDWDETISRATPEQRAALLDIARQIQTQPARSADAPTPAGSEAPPAP